MAQEISHIQKILNSHTTNHTEILKLLRENVKHVNSVVSDLIVHKLAGYYFLPELGNLTEQQSTCGYVVILREVRHLPRNVVDKLIGGISEDKSKEFQGVSFRCFDFAYPIAEIDSPWVEHLMQCFCNLFGRIGIKDIDKMHATKITEFALSTEGTK